jgi:hypothetical protein
LIIETVNTTNTNFYAIFHTYLWAGPCVVWNSLVVLVNGLAHELATGVGEEDTPQVVVAWAGEQGV